MRIAIVGSGVSGLVAAHLLHSEHEITVFEARQRIGGHIHTIRHEDGAGGQSVDTGFIVYNERNYPLFTELLRKLDIPTQPSPMSFSVRCDRTGLEYNGSTVRQLFVQKRNLLRLGHYRMIRDILRFNREAPVAAADSARSMLLGDYLEMEDYSPSLADHYLVPMGSALWSIPRQSVLEMPIEFFVRFFEHHGMLTVDARPEWRVIEGGSAAYMEAMIEPFQHRIRTQSPVRTVRREEDNVMVNGECFDEVILACHSDQALEVLEDPTAAESQVLRAFPYQQNRVVLHTDISVLPDRKGAWGAWNYHIWGGEGAPPTVTYNMNILQTLDCEQTYCVTLNPPDSVASDTVLFETSYSHPVYTRQGVEAQGRHAEISGLNRTHYCGAYWGFGFHEDGVRSAFRVAHRVGAES